MNENTGRNPTAHGPMEAPQPPEFPPGLLEPDLRRLDARLTRELRAMRIPPGLADRVHQASAGHLPRRLSLVGTDGRETRRVIVVRRQWWGRVAMAAMVVVGVSVGWNLLDRPVPPETSPMAGVVAPRGAIEAASGPDVVDLANAYALSEDAEWLLLKESATEGDDLSYLADTRGVSYYDLQHEIDVLAGARNEGGL